jgi:hypothetical protein
VLVLRRGSTVRGPEGRFESRARCKPRMHGRSNTQLALVGMRKQESNGVAHESSIAVELHRKVVMVKGLASVHAVPDSRRSISSP